MQFTKYRHSGVLLYGRRKGQTQFVLLAKQLRSPYHDKRANTIVSDPEMREYMAQYLADDEPVGQMSDMVTVIVPGDRMADDVS